MHLLLPHASALSDACAEALSSLPLPNLSALLRELKAGERNEGDEWSLSMPHERVLARALGWAGADGCLPLAAWHAEQDGMEPATQPDLAWGMLTPMHWHLGRDHLTVVPPSALHLSEAHSRELFDAALPLFTSDGWLLRWAAPTHWYVAHESLAELPTASLDRVVGRNPDRWMPDHPQARVIKRLQNEVQMLWYHQPANDERQAQGLLPVNSLWLWGCGRYQAPRGEAPKIVHALREPLLSANWPAWAEAWREVDATALQALLQAARAGQPVTLTLAGERHAQSWSAHGISWWTRAIANFGKVNVAATLANL